MDVQISPEPTEEERAAILEALELEQEAAGEPSLWRRAGLGDGAAPPEAGSDPRVVEP